MLGEKMTAPTPQPNPYLVYLGIETLLFFFLDSREVKECLNPFV
jgi:hypothetical protein